MYACVWIMQELPQGKRGDTQDRPVIKQKVEIIPNAPADEPIEAAVRDLPQEDATQNPQHQRRRPGRGAVRLITISELAWGVVPVADVQRDPQRLQEREVFQPFLSKVMAFPGNTYRYVRANPVRPDNCAAGFQTLADCRVCLCMGVRAGLSSNARWRTEALFCCP